MLINSADKSGSAVAGHVVVYADLFLWLDFDDELADLHKGTWELTYPRRLKP